MRTFWLRVVQDQDSTSFGWGSALLRLVGLYVAGAVFYIGFIWIFVDKRRPRLAASSPAPSSSRSPDPADRPRM